MNKHLYYAWANNDSGASVDINNGRRETSRRAIENHARAELGSGWTVHIIAVDVNSDKDYEYGIPAEFEAEVKTFRIR